ncbi:MAG: FAD-binding protein [Dehalococcoidia bacterium]|nr:FAD-binding protein [Dehalococcoidia bacterium]
MPKKGFTEGVHSDKEELKCVDVPIPVVHQTDVLIIGAGMAGMTAAIEASDRGAEVILVDKGPFARSGASGINWGHWFITELENPPFPKTPDGIFGWLMVWNEGIGNQKLMRSLAERIFEEKRALWTENTGSLCMRKAPDQVEFVPNTSAVYNALYPWMIGEEVKRRGIPVFERNMVTSLLSHSGVVVGATSVDIKTGGFNVFRAKSVIVATGPLGWLYGWYGVSALTPCQPECTGDGHALLYRAEAELQNMEFGHGEMYGLTPPTLAGSLGGAMATASSPDIADSVCNKDGEFFLKQDSNLSDFKKVTFTYGSLYKAVNEQIKSGKGGPNGGVFFNAKTGWEKNAWRPCLVRAKEYLGWDACAEPVEVMPSLYTYGNSSLIQANINENNETNVPGLYATGMAGMAFDGSTWGMRAGREAAKRAAGIEQEEIDPQQPIRERDRVYGILERNPRNPLRPHVIRHRVQKLATEYIALDRNDKGLRKCIAEIERIRKEDYPRMWVASKKHTWNREFLEALETEFMIDVQEMIARSALMRTESRSTHYRSDYPDRDDQNWLANVYIKRVNGKMKAEKRPVVATEISPEKIRGMLP